MIDYEIEYRELLKKHKELIVQLKQEKEMKLLYGSVLESASRSVAVINLDREIVWINGTAVKMYGYQYQEAIGKRIADLIFGPETDVTMIPEAFDKVMHGIPFTFEQKVYRKTGESFWIRAELRPLSNEGNNIDKIIVYGQDITKEKELEQRIKEDEARRELLQRHNKDIIYKIDLHGKIISVNEAWTRILGYTLEETLSRQGNYFFHPDDVVKAKAARKSLIDGTALSYNIEVRVIAKNGNIVWLNTTSTPLYSLDKEIIGFMGISKDVTQQKKTLQLQELLATHIKGMLSLHDKDTNYIYVSPSFEKITGWKPEELIGKKSFEFYHPEDIPKVAEYREANMKGLIKEDEGLQLRYRKKDGSYTWIEIYPTWFYDPYGDQMRTVISAQKVDKKKEEEKKILAALEEERKLNKLKSSFLGFVSHEFKTPLSIIKALCEIIKMGADEEKIDREQLKEDADSIDYEVSSLAGLIDEVLVMEELESGTLELNFKAQDIKTIIENANLKLTIKNKGEYKASINVVGELHKVPGDAKYLEMIFRNLLSNAFKYSEGRPEPIVTINFFDNQCVVCVKDFGIGIPEESINKLFNNFYRASNVGKVEGTGLGLSIVKRFVNLHHGNIVCVSKENEGTEMYVSLPVIKNEE